MELRALGKVSLGRAGPGTAGGRRAPAQASHVALMGQLRASSLGMSL